MSRLDRAAKVASSLVTLVAAAYVIWTYLPEEWDRRIIEEVRVVRSRVRGFRQARADQARLMWEMDQLASLCPHKLASEVDRMGHGR